MFDSSIRQRLELPLDRTAAVIETRGIHPNTMTGFGFLVGVGACIAVVAGAWWIALGMWLVNRVIDGLDGSVARRVGPTQLGGFLDIMADFAVYSGMVVAIGLAVPEARVAALFVLFAYYLNGAAFLAWSSLVAERAVSAAGTAHDRDERSLNFPAGLAEGFETILAMSLILVLPQWTVPLLWGWALIVGISIVQRSTYIISGLRS